MCANCAAPVSEGRCPVCRASRERLQHQEGIFAGLTPATLLALLVALIAVALVAHNFAA
ncbi:membrane protein [Streptomyces albireticuli]|uniref:Membrane protein n=1 Tax=Streptomyces albireticuli TaxID=1940 RepID=A0A1Z2L6C9_9ACTN|nr:membrane protein [Streptomyces albireticuli]